jgi:hypothetical protein
VRDQWLTPQTSGAHGGGYNPTPVCHLSKLDCRLTSVLPVMTLAEAIDTTRIHRVGVRTGARTALVTSRPCHTPIVPCAGAALAARCPPTGVANPGTNAVPAPLFGIGDTNLYQPLVGTHTDDALSLRHRGLVTFAGGNPFMIVRREGSWAGSG